ncbi:MAG: PQQ-binding-like beta-propeller repeat protein [Myxococcota bacterium]
MSRSIAALAAASLVGCAGVLGGGANPEQPLWVQRPSSNIEVVYSTPAVISARHSGEAYQRGQPELDVRGRRVFVGSSDGGLYAFRAEDGNQIWRFETLGFVQCSPLFDADNDALYFGSNDGALYRVDAKNGRLRWRFMTNAEVSRKPVLAGGTLYVTNANDTLLALNPETGELRWYQHRAPATGMEVAGYAGVAVYREKVYTGFSDGTVLAFDAKTGAERWQPVDLSAEAEQTLGSVPEQLDVDTTPVPDQIEAGAVVYVANYAGGVFALDAETGAQVWSNPGVVGVSDLTLWTQPAHTPTPVRGAGGGVRDASASDGSPLKLLIASSGTGGLIGLDPETGKERWRRRLPRGGASAPVPVLGALMISASQLGIFLVSPLGGELIDGIHVAGGVSMAPVAHGSRAFVLTNGGRFVGMHLTGPFSPAAQPTLGEAAFFREPG